MKWRTKRRAKRLAELVVGLETGEMRLEERAAALGDLHTAEQRESFVELMASAKEYLEKARAHQTEIERTGSISDPHFDKWFKEGRAFATMAQMTPEEYRAAEKIARMLPGGRD